MSRGTCRFDAIPKEEQQSRYDDGRCGEAERIGERGITLLSVRERINHAWRWANDHAKKTHGFTSLNLFGGALRGSDPGPHKGEVTTITSV